MAQSAPKIESCSLFFFSHNFNKQRVNITRAHLVFPWSSQLAPVLSVVVYSEIKYRKEFLELEENEREKLKVDCRTCMDKRGLDKCQTVFRSRQFGLRAYFR